LFGVIRFNSEIAGAGEFDDDDDGIINPADNCPSDPNPAQGNRDGDEFGDACDPYPDDADNLLVCVANVIALEEELEALRAQLADADGDGVLDSADQCPDTRPGTVVNGEGCSKAQFCEDISIHLPPSVWQCLTARFDEDTRRPSCRIRRLDGPYKFGCFARGEYAHD
jgi:hypothetical protein